MMCIIWGTNAFFVVAYFHVYYNTLVERRINQLVLKHKTNIFIPLS